MEKRSEVVSDKTEQYDQNVKALNGQALRPMMDPWDIPCPGCDETIASRCFACHEVRLFGGEVKGAESIIAARAADLRR